jgi:hypothetical protein
MCSALAADAWTSTSRPTRREEAEESHHARHANAGDRCNLRWRCRIDTAPLARQQTAPGLQLFQTAPIIRPDDVFAIVGDYGEVHSLILPVSLSASPQDNERVLA